MLQRHKTPTTNILFRYVCFEVCLCACRCVGLGELVCLLVIGDVVCVGWCFVFSDLVSVLIPGLV